MKKTILLFIMILLSSCNDVGDNKPLLSNSKEKQPIIIVNKNRHLNIPDFWIDRLENSEQIIMNPKEIIRFNDSIAHENQTLNYFDELPNSYSNEQIKRLLLGGYIGLKNRAKFFEDGSKIPTNFYRDIKEELNLEILKNSTRKTRYALTVKFVNQRVIPSKLALLKTSQQIHFDRNQNSALDIATPLAVIHSTENGQWHYAVGPTSSGWIANNAIAFADKEEIDSYLKSKKFVISTSAKSSIYLSGRYYDYLRMGVRLPKIMEIDDKTMVLIPSRGRNGKLILSNAILKTADVQEGYLPYTAQTILTQAFKFLHAPYGWGGMYGEQDCSKFIQEIYATVGIRMPRNSTSQSNVGKAKVELEGLDKTTRAKLLRDTATIGGTIVHLKGHIVLYLGEYKGEPYIIHTVWGESSEHFALGRTAVTSLNFNNYLSKIDKSTSIILD